MAKSIKKPARKKPAARKAAPKAAAKAPMAPKAPAAKNKGGRPSKFSTAVIARICERLSRGEPMAVICRDDEMPAYRTVKDWMDTKPDVSAAIARARDDGEDAIAADCLSIADDARTDFRMGDRSTLVETDSVQRAKLRIWTRLELLKKWNPKKWGDKLGVGQADGLEPVQTETVDRAARVAELMAEATRRGR